MESQMKSLLSLVQTLQLASTNGNKTNHGKNSDAVTDVEAAPVGEPDVDKDNHQLHPLQSIVGLTEIARTGAKNVQ